MATVTNRRCSDRSKQRRYIGKPTGIFQNRVAEVSPTRFGIITVDCAKRRSKWMLCDFYGRVIIEPTTVEHDAAHLSQMVQTVQAAVEAHGIKDTIVGVEITGIYHRPVVAAFRKAGFDTREVHSFASAHFRKTLHPNEKTDDKDLEAIFQAVVNGFGLAILPVHEPYLSLQYYVRFRRNLVKQRAKTQTQLRDKMHRSMPGYAELFEASGLFHNRVAFAIAKAYPSAELIREAGTKKLLDCLAKEKIRVVAKTVDRVIAWSQQAAAPGDGFTPCTDIWQQYLVMHTNLSEQITQAERKIASFLAQTPYILLLSIPGINVISAGELAGEAGPIEHYASAQAINGRAGLFPSRYQSDQVDRSGGVAWSCNRRLRAASILVAHNLIKCHPYYRGQAALMKSKRVATRDIECRIANRANRMVFQIVSGKQVWRGRGVDRDYLLKKLMTFHQSCQTDATQIVKDLTEAAKYLPKSHLIAEGQQLPAAPVRPRRGTQSLGALLLPLLIRLGVATEKPLELTESEV